jgi:hypothetical protein
MIALAVVLVRVRVDVRWPSMSLLVLAVVPMPLLQHAAGLIPLVGDAWVSTAYLLGLLMALQLGLFWHSAKPGQPMDALAIAIGCAGVVSVAIQLVQWQDLGSTWLSDVGGIGWRVWIVDLIGNRPYANMAQPNLLGTLLLWSLVSVGWAVHRQAFAGWVGVLLAIYLLFGLALTQSRTAWLGVAALVAMTWWWSALWRSPRIPLILTGLGVMFLVFTVFLTLGVDVDALGAGLEINSERLGAGQRPGAWLLFLDAAATRPWFGYGWNQVMVAHLAVAESHPALHSPFYHSHNLFLDLVLWCGIPIGLLITGFLVHWCVDRIRRADSAEQALSLLFLLVVGIHAMLELPLHYAYFLLPAGVIAGTLNAMGPAECKIKSRRFPMVGLAALAGLMLALIVYDYVDRIEANFLAMRFELARIGPLEKAPTPEVLVLTQLAEWLRLARYDSRRGMSEREVQWVLDVAQRNPTPSNLYKLAWTLAANGRPQEASQWLLKTRQLVSAPQWINIRIVWADAAKRNPDMAAVALPPDNDSRGSLRHQK